MNMTVTESDKKLLSFLAAFLLAIAFIFFVFRPLTEKNKALEKEISEAKQQEISIDMSASLSEDMSQTEQAVREQMTGVLQRFYPMLQSQDAGNMVTVLMLNHSLQIQNMQITMPEKASNLKWYQYSENATPMVPEEASQEEAATKSEEAFGVYAARVSCTAEGSREDLMALVDDISENYPAISILSTEWSTIETPATVPVTEMKSEDETDRDEETEDGQEKETPSTLVKTTGSLTITLEIYMCNQ